MSENWPGSDYSAFLQHLGIPARNLGYLPKETTAKLIDLARQTEHTLLVDAGLPGREWYKHLIHAPGRYTGYEPKTLPSVREAIEEERFTDVDHYAALTGTALDAYADKLDESVWLADAGGESGAGRSPVERSATRVSIRHWHTPFPDFAAARRRRA